MEVGTQTAGLAARAAALSWYHTIELPGGVRTAGFYDTVAGLQRFPFPASLAGRRCLDVGTADGFWAFEMERRGAAEVVAIDVPQAQDLDWPGTRDPDVEDQYERQFSAERGFDVAREAFGSQVQWRALSVYELKPEVVGTFDFVFVGSLLLHLRDPVAALMAIERVLGDGGELLSV